MVKVILHSLHTIYLKLFNKGVRVHTYTKPIHALLLRIHRMVKVILHIRYLITVLKKVFEFIPTHTMPRPIIKPNDFEEKQIRITVTVYDHISINIYVKEVIYVSKIFSQKTFCQKNSGRSSDGPQLLKKHGNKRVLSILLEQERILVARCRSKFQWWAYALFRKRSFRQTWIHNALPFLPETEHLYLPHIEVESDPFSLLHRKVLIYAVRPYLKYKAIP